MFGCDYVVSATGVQASTSYLDDGSIARAQGGEILVDEGLQSVSPGAFGVFAAGDCCQVCLGEKEGNGENESRQERHWFQMKLWSQVRKLPTLNSYLFYYTIYIY